MANVKQYKWSQSNERLHRLGVYSKIKKEQHGRITKTQFIPLSREEMEIFRNESESMRLIQVGETIEEFIGEGIPPISTPKRMDWGHTQ